MRVLQSDIGTGSCIRENILFEYDNEKRTIDGLVVLHLGGVNVPISSAYIIEAQVSPHETTVNELMDKVHLFKKCCPSSSYFNSVTKVVPVLAGKQWGEGVMNACSAKGIWRVTPSSVNKAYKVIRSFHTLLLKIKK